MHNINIITSRVLIRLYYYSEIMEDVRSSVALEDELLHSSIILRSSERSTSRRSPVCALHLREWETVSGQDL